MKTYLVGGAVRDQLLGLDVGDRDWVVVGATPQQMLDLGFRQVGKDFPVFLHPDTNEEYALARTERKIAEGYNGFSVDFSAHISLEDDLLRRDLTINAIAQDEAGQLIDPYGGLADLQAHCLRHVSDAFEEDPLRILRVARFHARLSHLGFTIHDSTFTLMQRLSVSDELDALSKERIWIEVEKGLAADSPHIFIDTLYRCGALRKLLPELDNRFEIRDNLANTEPVVGERVKQALKYLAEKRMKQALSSQAEAPDNHANANTSHSTHNLIAWAICCHALEADNDDSKIDNKDSKRDTRSINKIDEKNSSVFQLCTRLTCPNSFRRLAILSANYIKHCLQATESTPDSIINLLDICDAWRRPDQFEHVLAVAECLAATNPDHSANKATSITLLRKIHKSGLELSAQEFVNAGLQGPEISTAMRHARIMAAEKQIKALS